MPKLKGSLLTAVLLASGVMSACGGRGFIAVGTPLPPPPYAGPVGVAPGPGYVWINGFYDYSGGSWVWRHGYWAQPPYPNAVWISPFWEHDHDRYRFHRGYWRGGRGERHERRERH
jgi:hypothetical protein